MKIQPHVFREYDIRGTVDKELSAEFAYRLGRAYAVLVQEGGGSRVVIGQDCRESSPVYAKALGEGIAAQGLAVTHIGMCPTPELYFAAYTHAFDGGIQVTGSHNPADMNGFKLCLGQTTLSGAQIQNLRERMLQLSDTASGTPGPIGEISTRSEYLDFIVTNSKPHVGSRKLKVVVDAGNGVAGLTGPAALRRLGYDVIELYTEPDGTFPNHHPDPTVPETLVDLISTVKRERADLGIGWDGDGDRIGVVDENGAIVYGDMLMVLLSRAILKETPGATIIADVKSSQRLFADIARHGGKPIMWKTGHSLIKGKLRETGGALAGEVSGHIFFKHRFFGFDDAVYASVRLMEILSASTQPLSMLLADIPAAVTTPEIRVDCPEDIKFLVPERAKAAFAKFPIDTTDGVRITFEHGWGLVRASNTQPVLVLRFEADTPEHLAAYQALVEDQIAAIKQELQR